MGQRICHWSGGIFSGKRKGYGGSFLLYVRLSQSEYLCADYGGAH